MASVTESAALNKSERQSKPEFSARLAAALSPVAEMTASDSISTEGLLPRLGDDDDDGVERGDSC